jgi:hypothetical protein
MAMKKVDVTEWSELGAKLAEVGPRKFESLLDALRKIVEAQETIAEFDWQLPFRGRPGKRYEA